MSELLVPLTDDAWKKPPAPTLDACAATPRDLVSGEILIFLEQRGPSSLHHLIRELEWSPPLVTAALETLLDLGLIHMLYHELEVILELAHPQRLSWLSSIDQLGSQPL